MNKAFTLAELIVVVAIVLLLSALLIPAVIGSYDSAIRLTCASNLRQVRSPGRR